MTSHRDNLIGEKRCFLIIVLWSYAEKRHRGWTSTCTLTLIKITLLERILQDVTSRGQLALFATRHKGTRSTEWFLWWRTLTGVLEQLQQSHSGTTFHRNTATFFQSQLSSTITKVLMSCWVLISDLSGSGPYCGQVRETVPSSVCLSSFSSDGNLRLDLLTTCLTSLHFIVYMLCIMCIWWSYVFYEPITHAFVKVGLYCISIKL